MRNREKIAISKRHQRMLLSIVHSPELKRGRGEGKADGGRQNMPIREDRRTFLENVLKCKTGLKLETK